MYLLLELEKISRGTQSNNLKTVFQEYNYLTENNRAEAYLKYICK